MKIEQSRVKIIISNADYERLMAARDVILEMKEILEDESLGRLDFFQEIMSLEDSFDTFECNFEENQWGDYCMEVD